MARNEEDVLEAFVRHHAPLVDLMLIVDHRSVDRSSEILRLLEQEGLPLSIRDERSPIQRQWQIMTSLMREAASAHHADWIVALDADEFLLPADRSEVEAVLARLPVDAPAAVGLCSYIPTPADDPGRSNALERIGYRRERESSQLSKALVPSAVARDARYALTQGSHAVSDGRAGKEPLAPAEGLVLAHFPVRSAEQISRKVLGGWPAHAARPDRRETEAFQWKRLFDELAAGEAISAERLQEIALAYSVKDPASDPSPRLVHDPLPVPFALRYTEGLTVSPLAALAHTAEALAEELATLLGGASTAGEPARDST